MLRNGKSFCILSLFKFPFFKTHFWRYDIRSKEFRFTKVKYLTTLAGSRVVLKRFEKSIYSGEES